MDACVLVERTGVRPRPRDTSTPYVVGRRRLSQGAAYVAQCSTWYEKTSYMIHLTKKPTSHHEMRNSYCIIDTRLFTVQLGTMYLRLRRAYTYMLRVHV